jgi:hypothetical protein
MDEAGRLAWETAIRRELRHWHMPIACPHCGEWVGHWGGETPSDARPRCTLQPHGVPLQRVRPGCFTVRRHWIGDAIRAACEKRGEKRP